MLHAVKAVVKQGHVVPLENYPLKEGAEFLLVALEPATDIPGEALRLRREAAVRWYDEYLAQAGAASPAPGFLTEAEIVNLVHDAR